MPEDFVKCERAGGKIRTKHLPNNKYMKICIPKGGGSSVGGEVHKKKNFLDGRV